VSAASPGVLASEAGAGIASRRAGHETPGSRQGWGTAVVPLLLVLGLVTLCPSSAAAQGDDESAALLLLRRAMVAASTLSFQGVQVDATWTVSGMTTRMIDVRQGGGIRSMSVHGAGRTSRMTTSLPVRAPGQAVDLMALLAGAYTLSLAGTDEVAGRSARMVVVRRDSRVAARLWLDDDTGLLLRQEVWDAEGRLNRMVSYVELEQVRSAGTPAGAGSGGTGSGGTGSEGTASGELETNRSARGGLAAVSMEPGSMEPGSMEPGSMEPDVESSEAAARRLNSPCPTQLPGGFRLVDAREVTAAAGGGPGSTALHLTYTDGLSAVSVFVQSGRLPVAGPAGMTPQEWDGTRVYVGHGWPVRAVWQGDGRVLTVVSDAPPDDVTAVVKALPGGRARSAWERATIVARAAGALLPGR
jgi:hypothetical protein